MKIEIEQFRLYSNKEMGFDLYEVKTVVVGKTKGQKTEALIGYHYSITKALKKMTDINIHDQKLVVDFKGYLRAYKKEVDRLEVLASITA